MTTKLTKGKLISLEGLDGCGKTTQIQYMRDYLIDKGFDVLTIREPGGSEVGERIRSILLHTEMESLTELMLFTSSRMELITRQIVPALQQGKVVLADRFIDSSYAYQGSGRGLKQSVVYLEKLVRQYVTLDHTLYFDVSVVTTLERLEFTGKKADRFESEGSSFKQRVKQGFEDRLLEEPDRFTIIDADRSLVDVTQQVKQWMDNSFIPSVTHLQQK